MATAEPLGDVRGEPLEEAVRGGALSGERLASLWRRRRRQRGGVHQGPDVQKSPERLRQELEIPVLALAYLPVLVDGLGEAIEGARLVTEHVERLASDYIETLNHWIERFDRNLEEATELAGAERVRVFRLYLRAARNGFRVGGTGGYQVLARRRQAVGGPSF